MICGGENGTSGCHLTVFTVNVAFAHHFVATHPSTTLPPYKSASGIGYTSKTTVFKVVSNSASYLLNT